MSTLHQHTPKTYRTASGEEVTYCVTCWNRINPSAGPVRPDEEQT